MPLTDQQIRLIRTSFDVLQKEQKRRSVEFYENFFRRAPDLREMFRADIEGQGMRFFSTLSIIAGHLEATEAVAERLTELGQGHRAMGVERAHFEPMREALIDTLQSAMGEGFTPEMRAAWRAGFDEIAQALINKGAIGG